MTTPSELTAPDMTFAAGGEEAAANLTILVTGIGTGVSPVWIQLPASGELQIAYEWQDQPAQTAVLWHQGGRVEPIRPGINNYLSYPGDFLMYGLAYQGQSIKLGWAYL